MSNEELAKRTRDALAAFAALPPEEQKRRMIARGTINEKGEVLYGAKSHRNLNRLVSPKRTASSVPTTDQTAATTEQ